MQLPHNKSRLIIALEYLANKLNRLNKCSYRKRNNNNCELKVLKEKNIKLNKLQS